MLFWENYQEHQDQTKLLLTKENYSFFNTKHGTIKRIIFWLTPLLFSVFLISCDYDNEEDLYIDTPTCDTVNVIYSKSVKPIFSVLAEHL